MGQFYCHTALDQPQVTVLLFSLVPTKTEGQHFKIYPLWRCFQKPQLKTKASLVKMEGQNGEKKTHFQV